jgi:hypothetical protein
MAETFKEYSKRTLKLIIQKLDTEDVLYLDKIEILIALIKQPNIRVIIKDSLISWANSIRLIVYNNQQDRTSWKTCGLNFK